MKWCPICHQEPEINKSGASWLIRCERIYPLSYGKTSHRIEVFNTNKKDAIDAWEVLHEAAEKESH